MSRIRTSEQTDKLLKKAKKCLKAKEEEIISIKQRKKEEGVRSLEWRLENNTISTDYIIQQALEKLLEEYKIYLEEAEKKGKNF